MEQHHAVFAQNSAQLVTIAMGEVKHSKRYCGSLAPSVRCLVHKDAAPYYAYGLQQAKAKELLSLDVLKAGMRATTKGFLGGQPVGDVKMMPGMFVIDREGIVQYAYYSSHVGDHASMDALLTASKVLTPSS